MTSPQPSPADPIEKRASLAMLDQFSRATLQAAGADEATADAATRAMLHGSRLGVDSHGIRLLDHYVKVLIAGRVNPRPSIRIGAGFAAIANLDADHGHGALATYRAMEHAVKLAGTLGLGAVGIRNSSHFGPAGAYALAAADAGYIGLVFCNADSLVRLHDGTVPFHGTNPIACAVPSGGPRPWLFDMATSTVPLNRVLLNRSLGRLLPPGAASAADGTDTEDPENVAMLAPLGGAFGYKGAGLASLAEIFSAVLTGMRFSVDMLPMGGQDLSTPRELGAFVLALRPDAIVDAKSFQASMQLYLDRLRASPARAGAAVLAPGDREWAEAAKREAHGVPIDPETEQAFQELSTRYGIALPFAEANAP